MSEVTPIKKQIPEQIDYLENELSKLHDKISLLTDRLSSALISNVPETATPEDGAELVLVATSIRSFGSSVKNARMNIECLLDRIEL